MNKDILRERLKQFALRIIALAEALPNSETARIIKRQIIRCGTSAGSNYRAACRAKSKSDFVAKIAIVEEETDESAYWLELIIARKLLKPQLVESLLKEADEITAIMVSSRITAKKKI